MATYGFETHETPYIALVGGLGTGKTCLAAHFARQLADSQDLVVWITASTRDAVLDAYAEACAYVVRPAPADRNRAAERFLNWAESTKHSWVIVLDGVREPADVRGLLPPRRANGLTLLTTRRRDVPPPGPAWRQVEVGGFTDDECADFLWAVVEENDLALWPGEIDWLLARIGNLPILVERIASRAVETGDWPEDIGTREFSLDAYANVWTAAAREELTAAVSVALPDAGVARAMARLLSMLPPGPFPVAAFTSDAVRRHLGDADPEEALSLLRTYSIVDGTDDAPTWPAPALLCVTWGPGTGEPDDLARARVVADGLLESWPHSLGDDKTTDSFVDSARYMIDISLHAYQPREDSHGDAPDIPPLVFPLIATLGNSGDRWAAERLAGKCLECVEGPDADLDPDFHSHPAPHLCLRLRREALRWFGESGHARFETLKLSELVAQYTTTLGADDVEVLITRSQLAHAMTTDRRPADAERELAALIPVLERHVDLWDEERLIALGRHGIALAKARPDEPPNALDGAVAEMTARLGQQHRVTAEYRIALALELRARADDATPIEDDLAMLSEATAVLGRRHPRVIDAELRFATTVAQGLTADALTRLCGSWRACLGYTHPLALVTAMAVAQRAVEEAADDATARSAAIAALAQETVKTSSHLGLDHPDVLDARALLARYSGDAWSRVLALTTITADWQRRYGGNHPDAMRARTARNAAEQAAIRGSGPPKGGG
ncbi:ATP-binding protein [Yinghuangia seranimata]|uniref:ATP-binding protein n=1 Tax=Yinghuangia seranimata TaxID=408067 RepID=UPI00248C62E2|nr:ATP-binding protein [Yinghuangia seranimata]MDI2129505.1 ATP-binding protein [Yinghuangia seranimata]